MSLFSRRSKRRQQRQERVATPADESVDLPQLASELADEQLEPVGIAELEIAADSTPPDSDIVDTAPSSRRRPVKSRGTAPSRVRWGLLFVLLAIIVLAVVLLLNAQNLLPAEVFLWWPLTLLVPGFFWLLASLVRRSGRGLLASSVLVGIGISLLLGTQTNQPVGSTLVGIVLITSGAGLLLRGLLMGRQPLRMS